MHTNNINMITNNININNNNININEERNRYLSIIILSTTLLFLFADQNLLAPNLSLIANEFNFNDIQRDEKLGRDIAIGFFCIGGFFSLIVGYLTDKIDRIILFALIVGIVTIHITISIILTITIIRYRNW
jgi:MFS family permease